MAVVGNFINSLDPSKQEDATIKEIITAISKIADARIIEFTNEMNSSWTKSDADSLAPGVTKDFEDAQTHVMTSDDLSPVTTAIGTIVDQSFRLDANPDGARTATFIKQLAAVGFNALLGSASGEETSRKQYIIYPDGNFICRCDTWFWMYRIQAVGIRSRVTAAVAYRMQYGAVDITQVNKIALARWFDRWHLDPAAATALLQKMNTLIDAATTNPPRISDRLAVVAQRAQAS